MRSSSGVQFVDAQFSARLVERLQAADPRPGNGVGVTVRPSGAGPHLIDHWAKGATGTFALLELPNLGPIGGEVRYAAVPVHGRPSQSDGFEIATDRDLVQNPIVQFFVVPGGLGGPDANAQGIGDVRLPDAG